MKRPEILNNINLVKMEPQPEGPVVYKEGKGLDGERIQPGWIDEQPSKAFMFKLQEPENTIDIKKIDGIWYWVIENSSKRRSYYVEINKTCENCKKNTCKTRIIKGCVGCNVVSKCDCGICINYSLWQPDYLTLELMLQKKEERLKEVKELFNRLLDSDPDAWFEEVEQFLSKLEDKK